MSVWRQFGAFSITPNKDVSHDLMTIDVIEEGDHSLYATVPSVKRILFPFSPAILLPFFFFFVVT